MSSKVQEAALQGLHPTQLTVGMIVVQDKRKHLYANGVRHCYSMIPDSLDKLVDDVYRSLAGYVRDADGFDKTAAAYTEFIWADFFRRNIAVETVKSDFQTAVQAGISLAQSKWAKNIPGYNRK